MFTLRAIVQPQTLEEAYQALVLRKNNAILGGCAFLKLGSQRIDTGIDLSKLGLNFIAETEGQIEIGATSCLRDLETHPAVKNRFSGLLGVAVRNIIGVQFRNVATVGGSVFAKYGFSDLLTALLVLDTDVVLYKGGRQKLIDFLHMPYERDILTSIIIKTDKGQAAYQSLRNSASDFPVLNVAVANLQGTWRVAVGARPGRASLANSAASVLNDGVLSDHAINLAAQRASEELTFGANMRGTADYRRTICQTLIKRAIKEAVQ